MKRRTLFTAIFLLGLLPGILQAQNSWVPDTFPAGSDQYRANISSMAAILLKNGCQEELKDLQRFVFLQENIYKTPGEPVELAGSFSFLKGDWNSAQTLWASSTSNPDLTVWHEALIAFARRNYPDALAACEKLSAANSPLGKGAAYLAGLCHIRLFGNTNGALADLAEARQKRLDNSTLTNEDFLDLIWARHYLGQDDIAIKLCETAYGKMPQDPRLFYLYGLLLVRQNQFEQARGAFAQAINFGARHPQVSMAYAGVCQELGMKDEAFREQAAAEELFSAQERDPAAGVDWYDHPPALIISQAGSDTSQWRLEKARESFQKAGESWQGFTQEGLGDIAWLKGSASAALVLYQQALAHDPLRETARLKLSAAYLETNSYAQAFQAFFDLQEFATFPKAFHAYSRLMAEHGPFLNTLGDLFALSFYETQGAISQDPDDGEAHRTAAAILFSLRHFDRAGKTLATARRKTASDDALTRLLVLNNWREAQYAQRPLKQAEVKDWLALLTPIAEKDPAPVNDYLCARLQENLSRKDLAKLHYQRCLARKGEEPTILYQLALEAKSRGATSEACTFFERIFKREYESSSSVLARRLYLELSRNISSKEGK